MIETSSGYKAAIRADSERDTFEASFGFLPPGSVEGANVAASAEAPASRLAQVRGDAGQMSARWATCERDRLILDGSFTLMDDRDSTQQIGFFSAAFCDESGMFAEPYPYVDYILDKAYDLIGVTVSFDAPGGEWASAFTVQYYGADGVLLQTLDVENAAAVCAVDLLQVGVQRFRVTVTRWNVPRRMAKIAQVLPGQFYLFTPDNTYEFLFSECIQPFESALTLPEFTVVFDNADKKFDIVNPKGLIAYLRQKMKVSAKLGILVDGADEFVGMGDFYVDAWPDDTQEDKASLTCRPSMAFESRSYQAPGTGTQTVAEAAAILFEGIDEPYTVDAALAGIMVNQYIGDDVPKADAMGQLAVACAGYWKIGRDGSYQLVPWQPPAASNTIDYDNAWTKPTITQGKRYTSTNVKYFVYDGTNKQLKDNDHIVSLDPDDGEQKTISSAFIADEARAEAVAQAALAYYALRLSHSVQYRGDMSIEAGDTVKIENDYARSDVCVLSHEITYDADKISGHVKGVGL